MIKFLKNLLTRPYYHSISDLPPERFFSYQLLRHCDQATSKGWMSK